MSKLRTKIASLRVRAISLRTHIDNAVSYLTSRTVSAVLFLIPIPWFIERHGDSSYGTATMLLLVFSYLHMVDLGFGYAVNLRIARSIARRTCRTDAILGTAWPIYAVCASVIALLILAAAGPFSNLLFGFTDNARYIRMLAPCTALLMFSSLLTATLQAHNKINWINYSRVILDVAKAGGLLWGGMASDPLPAVLIAVLIGCCVKTLVDFLLVQRVREFSGFPQPAWSVRDFRINAAFGLPMMMSTMLGILLTGLDRVYVSRLLGQAQLAHYSIAADLCSRGYMISWAIIGSIYTLLIRRQATGRTSHDLFSIMLMSVLGIVLVFYLPLALFAEVLLGWWIAPEFASAAAPSLRIWTGTATAYLFMCVYHSYIQSQGRPRLLLVGSLIACAVLVSALWFISGEPTIEAVATSVLLAFGSQALFLVVAKARLNERRK